MKLFIMRHGEAESGAQLDPTRSLTDTGKAQAKMMGRWMERQGHKPGVIVQSNFKRSQSTAKRVAKHVDARVITMGALDPDSATEAAWRAIKDAAKAQKTDTVLIVTHGPLVENLLCYLVGSPLPRQIHFAHATIAYLETTTGARGILHWMVSPNTVARDDDEMNVVTSDAHATIEAALVIAEVAVSAMPD